MIGHCTALAVIVTKTLAGKLSELKQDKEAKLTTPHVVGVITNKVPQLQVSQLINPARSHI